MFLGTNMWKKIECVAIYTDNIEASVDFYKSLGLTKAWEAFQDEEKLYKLVGMKFSDGDAELVLKNKSDLKFTETEIVDEDVKMIYESLKNNSEIEWSRHPFPNSLGGYVAVMRAPDGNVFVLIGK